jgi:amino acid permease
LPSQGNRSSVQEDSYRDEEAGGTLGDSARSLDDEEDDVASIRTQRTRLDRRDLNMFDVAALIINKMIGTGIFTTPGLVLSLTGNKKVSIIMWLCGSIWSFLR